MVKQSEREKRGERDGAMREALYQRYLGEQGLREARNIVWDQQREGECVRHGAITREKHRMRDDMAGRLGYRAARSIATAWAAEQREALNATIDDERTVLRAKLDAVPASSWRAFIANEAEKGDRGAQDVLRGMKKRDAQAVGTPSQETPAVADALEIPCNRRPHIQEVAGMRHCVLENGDVSYGFADLHSRVFGGAAFVDRGSRITIDGKDPRSARVAMEYVRAELGDTAVSLHLSASSNAMILREAVKAGLNVQNPELRKEVNHLRNELSRRVFVNVPEKKGMEQERGL